ncbi:hypothetical protein FQN54_008248 [Arachnomyces sp. PD_36]|nr:hypothetical protein FQN54_008248 [Arachnomyces sp. PD_36]
MIRPICENLRPGRRRPVSANRRSSLSHLASLFLILTTLLLTLCSPVIASPDNTCAPGHVDKLSHSKSHSLILGRGARQDDVDEINEIALTPRADSPDEHSEHQKDNDDKGHPSKPSDDTKSPAGKGDTKPDDDHEGSPEHPSDDSNPKDETKKPDNDDKPPVTTSSSEKSSITTTSTADALTVTASGTISADTEIQTAPPIGSDSPLPEPFDSNIGTNFTTPNCPKFLEDFRKNSTFLDCHPMSLLIKNSLGFFELSNSAPAVSRVLDASCAVSEPDCTAVMIDLATQLGDDANCGQELENNQSVVRAAYNGLISYQALYRATCLKNPLTHSYCYVDAATNVSNPEDSYPYLLPLGSPFPGGVRPSCNRCLQATMEIFADTARVEGQPLVDTYMPAAQLISITCGPSFVNTTVELGTLPAIDAAPASLGSMSMGFASLLSAGVMLSLLY